MPITAMPGRAAVDSLIAAATPDDQPAAADRHQDRADVGALIEDLQPERALAGDDPCMIERRHHRQARAPRRSASAFARRCSDVVPSNTISAPNPLAPSDLIFGAVVGITTTAGAPRARAAIATAWP